MLLELMITIREERQFSQDLAREIREQQLVIVELQNAGRAQQQDINQLHEEVLLLKTSKAELSHPQQPTTVPSSNGSPSMMTKANSSHLPQPPHHETYAQKVCATSSSPPSTNQTKQQQTADLPHPSMNAEWMTQRGRRQRRSLPQEQQARTPPQNPLKARVRSLLPPLVPSPRSGDEASTMETPSVQPSPEERIKSLLHDEMEPLSIRTEAATTPTPVSPPRQQQIPITCVRVQEPRFNRACRSAPKEAWHLLLREKARPLQLQWSILDILPISPTMAEIYLPLNQISSFQTALGDRFVDPSLYSVQESDFKRRLAAYRMGYFKELRLAALQGLSRPLQVRLLREAALASPTIRTRHRDIKASAKHDLEALGASLHTTPPLAPHQADPPAPTEVEDPIRR